MTRPARFSVSPEPLPLPRPEDRGLGRLLDAHLHLLDRQVHDVDGVPVCVVDDLEISDVPAGPIPSGTPPPQLTSLLSGPVLATRMFGGRPPPSRVHRIPWTDLQTIGTALTLSVPGAALEVTWLERWVRDHIIGRIPGGRHDPQ